MFSEAEMRDLPLPSPEQHREFVAHLRNVHSWYKHLPLLTGGIFVVFLAPDAGYRYPTQHPSLPYGSTVEGYRRAFGYLDYIWSVDNLSFQRDGGHLVALPIALVEQCHFTLYPYVSGEFYWSVHEQAIASLRTGTPHPERTQLLEWEAASKALERAEREGAEVSEQMRLAYKEQILSAPLQMQEVARIEQHLHRLYQWHGNRLSGPTR